jgi:glycosyltransferase involved in cell wall biosynthesis
LFGSPHSQWSSQRPVGGLPVFPEAANLLFSLCFGRTALTNGIEGRILHLIYLKQETIMGSKKIAFCIIAGKYIREAIGGAEVQCNYIARELLNRDAKVYYIHISNIRKNPYNDSGIEVHPIYIPKFLNMILDKIHFIKIPIEHILLANTMKKIKADYWYYRSFNSFFVSIAKIKKNVGGKMIFALSMDAQSHKKSWEKRYGKIYHKLFERSLNLVDFFIFQKETQRREFISQYGYSGKVIYNGHPEETVIKNNKKNKMLVTWVGNLKKFKHPEIFFEIIKKLNLENIEYHIAGKAFEDFNADIMKLSEIKQNFHYHGRIDNKDVLKLLNKSYILISTSKNTEVSSEGFPNVFIESWKYGVPVISFINPDGIIDKYNVGYVCRDKNDMIAKIEYLVNDPDTYNVMSQNCKKLFQSRFNIKDNVDALLDYIEK